MESAPSPKNLRKKLGNLKATKKASVSVLLKKDPITISLIKPNTLETKVPADIRKANHTTF